MNTPGTPIDATLPIAVTLTAQQWLVIREILTTGPFRTVAQLIASVDQQLEQAVSGTALIAPGNGAARAMPPAE